MKKPEFRRLVENALEDVIQLAETRAGKPVSREIAFKWIGSKMEPLRSGVIDALVERIFVDEDKIYPCVDLGVVDILDDGTPLVCAAAAGFSPGPFARNWTDREGPFVRIVGNAFLAKMEGKAYQNGPLIEFLTPDMKHLD